MSIVAFIGLGAMGGPMALNLIAAGHGLRVFNRNPARCAQAVAEEKVGLRRMSGVQQGRVERRRLP